MIEEIYKQYMNEYAKNGYPPTRIILGEEVYKEALKSAPQYIGERYRNRIYCFGKPVTVDYDNPKLIHISKGCDYTVELKGMEE
jgi:nicotinic acid phosphoribosyltransferase